ncbi:hypothetical protein [Phocaeicola vulgatus]|uniref:hypothetical protein n=1 Tax=Phocaeicola vulgatus TaxID=821 RepID=UPI0035656D2F
MELKNIILTILTTIVLTSCYASNQISKFSSENIELGIEKNLFIKRYGKPLNKETSYTQDNQEKEKLFYKEELYKGTWYIVTTAFTFIDDKLIKQEVVKEERTFQKCDCNE